MTYRSSVVSCRVIQRFNSATSAFPPVQTRLNHHHLLAYKVDFLRLMQTDSDSDSDTDADSCSGRKSGRNNFGASVLASVETPLRKAADQYEYDIQIPSWGIVNTYTTSPFLSDGTAL